MADTAIGPGDRRSAEPAPSRTAKPAEEAARSLAAVEHATMRLWELAIGLDERSVRQASLLPGWTRAHVLTHLARNADGCVNLLRWARTGVEHPMYASTADRDADIEEGSGRGHRLLLEDLAASSDRLTKAARHLPESAWSAEVAGALGPMPARDVLRIRLLEVWVHLADLDHGFGFQDIPEADAEQLLEDVVQHFGGRPDVPAVSVTVDFGERLRTWDLRGTTSAPHRVQGEPAAVLGWLLGRTTGDRLSGDVPELPVWL